MRFLRKRLINRTLSIFMILVFVQSVISPYYAFALTTGPHQPEYISYESPGAQDMVNLLTGDFTYSLPMLDIPSPDGNFSMPLTYNAGIGLDQEASWVGLGWTVNAGAIVRTINEFPDDASGEPHSITVKDPGVRGWSSALLGLGYAGWNTEQGHYGTIGLLGISWDNSGVLVNPIALASTAMMAVSVIGAPAATTVAAKAAHVASKVMSLGLTGVEIAKNLANSQAPNAPSAGSWDYTRKVKQRFLHKDYWIWLDQTRVEDMLGVLYLQNADLEAYSASVEHLTPSLKINGNSFPLKKFPKTANYKGSASDMSYYMPSWGNYEEAKSPALLAFDDYSVKAPQIGGSIHPYRLDIGTVAMPRKMTKDHDRLVPLAYQSYKVPFVYDGMPSSSYFHHVGKSSGDITQPAFYYGISKEVGDPDPDDNTFLTYDFDDIIFDDQRVSPLVSSTHKMPQGNHIEYLTNEEIKNTAQGFSNGYMDYFQGSNRFTFRDQLDFGHETVFYSASETFGDDGRLPITDSEYFSENSLVDIQVVAYPTPGDWLNEENGDSYNYNDVEILDVDSDSITLDKTVFDLDLAGKACRVTITTPIGPKMPKSIGGFSITGADGMTYHFALPVYDYNNETSIVNKDDAGKKSLLKRNEPFASTWLLTGITGPDFVDRGGGTEGADANGIIDDRDWGYWVKLNYGNAADDFKWSIPYDGSRRDPTNASDISSSGYKQLYYLNSIETRSHAAVFIKEKRKDSRSANDVESLCLKEICLLTREAYDRLTASSPDGFGLTPVSGSISELWMTDDFYNSSGGPYSQGNFIVDNALKRIKFNYSYSLCKQTPNSTDVGKGKLTLERLSLLGRSDVKLHPDYVFGYGSNPNYGEDLWDGFGMYKADGSSVSRVATGDGKAWSLTKITTPLGATIDVDYERDTYSHVSEEPVTVSYVFNGNGGQEYDDPYSLSYIDELKTFTGGTTDFSVNQELSISGTIEFDCSSSSVREYVPFSGTYTVVAKTANSITVDPPVLSITDCTGSVSDLQVEGTITRFPVNKIGGNIRVASIEMNDELGQQQKIRYLYDKEDGLSSGVISKEPEYGKTAFYDFDTSPGYPSTPVLYGKVTVLIGILSTDEDFTTKQVYEFETPHSDMIDSEEQIVEESTVFTHPFFNSEDEVLLVKNEIENHTSKIGNLKSTKVYDKTNNLVSETSYDYTEEIKNPGNVNAYQGIYSEGTLMFDMLQSGLLLKNKITRTTLLKYPSVLQKVITVKDGFTSVSENTAWDFLTGQPLEKIQTSPLGLKTKSISVPAYTQYPEMGSKAQNITNKNMLSQITAGYAYKLNSNNTVVGIMEASATTWEDDANGVWRKNRSFSWKGNYVDRNDDGSRDFDDETDVFDFSPAAANEGWQFLNGVTTYDHYSLALESVDLNGIYTATRSGYNETLKIAEATNARYNEIAFSSGEDLIPDGLSFGGGVALGSGMVKYLNKVPSATSTHTGEAVVSLTSGYAFVFQTSDLDKDKRYCASVWTNSENGRIYYKINGGSENLSSAPSSSAMANGWYRIDLEIPVQSSDFSLEIGVESQDGEVYFDDFRFQPLEASMTCYVYSPPDLEFTGNPSENTFNYVLNNKNLYTKYEHDERGQLVKTYQESLTYGVKLISERKNNYRRFTLSE